MKNNVQYPQFTEIPLSIKCSKEDSFFYPESSICICIYDCVHDILISFLAWCQLYHRNVLNPSLWDIIDVVPNSNCEYALTCWRHTFVGEIGAFCLVRSTHEQCCLGHLLPVSFSLDWKNTMLLYLGGPLVLIWDTVEGLRTSPQESPILKMQIFLLYFVINYRTEKYNLLIVTVIFRCSPIGASLANADKLRTSCSIAHCLCV